MKPAALLVHGIHLLTQCATHPLLVGFGEENSLAFSFAVLFDEIPVRLLYSPGLRAQLEGKAHFFFRLLTRFGNFPLLLKWWRFAQALPNRA
jgi:hypothetical protein